MPTRRKEKDIWGNRRHYTFYLQRFGNVSKLFIHLPKCCCLQKHCMVFPRLLPLFCDVRQLLPRVFWVDGLCSMFTGRNSVFDWCSIMHFLLRRQKLTLSYEFSGTQQRSYTCLWEHWASEMLLSKFYFPFYFLARQEINWPFLIKSMGAFLTPACPPQHHWRSF